MNEVTQRSRDRVTQQQNDITQITASINELSESTNAVAKNASSAAEAAREANNNATEGQAVVKQVVESINSLADEIDKVASIVERVEKESDEIGDALSVFRSVSEQTNLLALNAAIEAARAGEHGRGFAVVADEVHSLSTQIQAQTASIQHKIESLQSGSSKAVAAMIRGKEKTSLSVGLANNAGYALDAISTSVGTITDFNEMIAHTTNEQSVTMSDIQQRTAVINQIAIESAQATDLSAASSNEFAIMTAQLQDLVQQFLLDDNNPKQTAPNSAPNNTNEVNAEGNVELF